MLMQTELVWLLGAVSRGDETALGPLGARKRLTLAYAQLSGYHSADPLAAPQARCARRDAAAETAGIEVYVYRCPNAPRFKALVYRDSNAIPLIPMLAENFSRSTFVSSAQLDAALVDKLRPDIVVEEMVERTLASAAALPMKR